MSEDSGHCGEGQRGQAGAWKWQGSGHGLTWATREAEDAHTFGSGQPVGQGVQCGLGQSEFQQSPPSGV